MANLTASQSRSAFRPSTNYPSKLDSPPYSNHEDATPHPDLEMRSSVWEILDQTIRLLTNGEIDQYFRVKPLTNKKASTAFLEANNQLKLAQEGHIGIGISYSGGRYKEGEYLELNTSRVRGGRGVPDGENYIPSSRNTEMVNPHYTYIPQFDIDEADGHHCIKPIKNDNISDSSDTCIKPIKKNSTPDTECNSCGSRGPPAANEIIGGSRSGTQTNSRQTENVKPLDSDGASSEIVRDGNGTPRSIYEYFDEEDKDLDFKSASNDKSKGFKKPLTSYSNNKVSGADTEYNTITESFIATVNRDVINPPRFSATETFLENTRKKSSYSSSVEVRRHGRYSVPVIRLDHRISLTTPPSNNSLHLNPIPRPVLDQGSSPFKQRPCTATGISERPTNHQQPRASHSAFGVRDSAETQAEVRRDLYQRYLASSPEWWGEGLTPSGKQRLQEVRQRRLSLPRRVRTAPPRFRRVSEYCNRVESFL